MTATRYLRKEVVDCNRDLSTAGKSRDDPMARLSLSSAESQGRRYWRAGAKRSAKQQ